MRMQIGRMWKSGKRSSGSRLGAALPLILSLSAALGSVPALAGVRGIASVNLCADQLLLALANPRQIASVGPFAADPSMSFLWRQARGIASNRGRAEELVKLDARIVLTGAFDNRFTRALLREKGLKVLVLLPWTSFAQGQAQIARVGKLVGQQERAAGLIQEIDKELRALEAFSGKGRQWSALVLHRRGYVLHAGVIGELMARAGVKNAAKEIGLRGDGTVALEQIVVRRPDFLIAESKGVRPEDQGEAILVHPALRRLYPEKMRLVLPQKLTVCPGPATPALVRRFRKELEKATKAAR